MPSSPYEIDEPMPVARAVYSNLRRAIISGQLAPGTRIVEDVFARSMGVSRTPLREALARLEVNGLVLHTAGTGYKVADIPEQLVEIYHLRKAIEGYCARLVAETGSPGLVAALRDNLAAHRAIACDDLAGHGRLNSAFHDMITDACPSRKVRERAAELRDFIFSPEEVELRPDQATVTAFLDEHELIIDAIEARDGDTAARTTRRHLERSVQLVLSMRAGEEVEAR